MFGEPIVLGLNSGQAASSQRCNERQNSASIHNVKILHPFIPSEFSGLLPSSQYGCSERLKTRKSRLQTVPHSRSHIRVTTVLLTSKS